MKEKRKGRNLSRKARVAMATAGAKNLAAFREIQAAAEGRPNIGAEMDRWRAEMLAELGANVNARRRVLVDAAGATYGCILLVINKLRGARVSDSGHLLERTSFLVGNVTRLLKMLELPARPKPRTLAEALATKPAPPGEIERAKSSIPSGSGGKPA